MVRVEGGEERGGAGGERGCGGIRGAAPASIPPTRPCPPGRYGSFPAEEGATTTKAAARAEAFVFPSPPFPATPSTSTFEHSSTGVGRGWEFVARDLHQRPGRQAAEEAEDPAADDRRRRRGGGTGTPPKSESLQNLPSLAWVASAAADAKAQAADAPLQRYQ